MITKHDIAAIFSAAYASASLRDDCDMRMVADLFETVRSQLDYTDPYETWDFISTDRLKYDNELSFELLSGVKDSYYNFFFGKLLSHLDSMYLTEPEDAILFWEEACAEAAIYCREDVICMLCLQQQKRGMESKMPERYLKLAKLIQESRWADTVPFYEEISSNPKFPQKIRAFAEIIISQIIIYQYLEFSKVPKHIENAETLLPGHFLITRSWAEYYLKIGETEKSRDYLLRVISMKPGDYTTLNLLGDSFMAENKLESAESWYNEASQKNILQTDSYRRLVILYGIKTWFTDKWSRIEELVRLIGERPKYGNYNQLIEKGLAEVDCFKDLQLYHAFRVIADAFIGNDAPKKAEEWYLKAQMLYPEIATAYIDLAYLKLHLNQHKQAKELLLQAKKVDNENFEVYWALAYYYQLQEQKEEAIECYKKCFSLRPHWEYMINNFIGNLFYSLKEYNKAIVFYRMAVDSNNQYPVFAKNLAGAYQILADQLFGSQDYPTAEKMYIEAAKSDNDANRWNTLGNFYYDMKRWNEAIDSYKKAMEIRTDPVFIENCGLAYERNGNFEEAEKYYLEALEVDPESAKLFNRLGVFYHDQTQYEKSIGYYLKALEREPNNLLFLENLALAYSMKNDYGAAIEIYEKFLQISPANAKILNAMGVIYYNQQQYESAIEMYHKALEIDKDNFLYTKNLGLALRVSGFNDEAIETYKRANEINDSDYIVWNELGVLSYNEYDNENAIAYYQKAIELQPGDPVLYSNLAMVFNAQGKPDEALNVMANYQVSDEVKNEVNLLLKDSLLF